MTFQDDLNFAKQVVALRDAFIAGEFDDYGYLKHFVFSDADMYRYTLKNNFDPPTVFRVNTYSFDGVSSFQPYGRGFAAADYTFIHHNYARKFYILETNEFMLQEDFECTEEFHFQLSLLYSDNTVREMITFAYLMKHPMPKPYEYFTMNMVYFDEMNNILIRLREKANAK